MTKRNLTTGTALATVLMAGAAHAATLEITITNEQAEGGLYLTPLFVALHDGTYDTFTTGEAASSALELLAEEGSPADLIAQAPAGVTTGVITSPGGFAGAPVIDPGETASITLNVDPSTQRFLSFLSMIIPSNDAFIGNGNPEAYEVFDASGAFTALAPITVSRYYDAGTEVNDGQGAAFNPAGGTGTDEGGVVTLLSDLDFLLGQDTVAGTTVTSVSGPLATVSIAAVPLPAGLPLMIAALGALGFGARRKHLA